MIGRVPRGRWSEHDTNYNVSLNNKNFMMATYFQRNCSNRAERRGPIPSLASISWTLVRWLPVSNKLSKYRASTRRVNWDGSSSASAVIFSWSMVTCEFISSSSRNTSSRTDELRCNFKIHRFTKKRKKKFVLPWRNPPTVSKLWLLCDKFSSIQAIHCSFSVFGKGYRGRTRSKIFKMLRTYISIWLNNSRLID